jgi:hypothetical protein
MLDERHFPLDVGEMLAELRQRRGKSSWLRPFIGL